MAAVAEGMFENTLDVVKLEPRDKENPCKTWPEEKMISTMFKVTEDDRGKQNCATASSNSPLCSSTLQCAAALSCEIGVGLQLALAWV